MSRFATVFCNLCWFASVIPGWVMFQLSLMFPKRTQQRILRRILHQNARTETLRKEPFAQRVPQDYDALWPDIQRIMKGERNLLTSEQPFLLEPTGGSSGGTKLIPYTHALKREYQWAINPWIASLFLKWPSLLFGRHYWCITPSTLEPCKSAIPVGFDTDAAYLGRVQQYMTRRIFAVPPEVARCTDRVQATDLTLVHLLNSPDLRLVSVWHPSLLTQLLKTLEERFDTLIESVPPPRARALRAVGCVPSLIWKKLKVISCWSGEPCRPWIERLQFMFPNTTIQPKGLVATEGISSIPLGCTLDVAAVRSHYYEFECEETRKLVPLWELESSRTYHLILTTGGGLYRYPTHDRVKVTGYYRRTPRIRFLTRNNITSDLFGEKISIAQAERICSGIPCRYTGAMIAPVKDGHEYRYTLYIEAESIPPDLHDYLEEELSRNFHYRHARNLGQLEHAIVQQVDGLTSKIIHRLLRDAKQAGSVKVAALQRETDWNNTLMNDAKETG